MTDDTKRTLSSKSVLQGYAAIAAGSPRDEVTYKSLVLGGHKSSTDSEDEPTTVRRKDAVRRQEAMNEREDKPLVAKEQICFDFTKGQCKRGEHCKFSHDVGLIIRVNSQEKGICFDFLKGMCSRGVMCRFSHDLNNLKPMLDSPMAGSKKEVIGKGKKKSPICYDFLKSKCAKGDHCRYSHDYTALFNQVHRKDGSTAEQANPNTIPLTDAHRNARNWAPPVCVDHLRGRCARGDACDSPHIANQVNGIPASAGLMALPLENQTDANQDTLENLIAQIRRAQLENAFFQNDRYTYVDNREADFASAMSYPPPAMSEGARLMDAYYRSHHTGMPPVSINTPDTESSPFRGIHTPMSPPVTHAEKMRMSMKTQYEDRDLGSPTIGAGWSHGSYDSQQVYNPRMEQPLSPLSPMSKNDAEDLHRFLTVQSIWAQKQL